MRMKQPSPILLALMAGTFLVGACETQRAEGPAEIEIRGTDPAQPPAPIAVPTTPIAAEPAVGPADSATGILTYDGYQSAIARPGDTVGDVANRIGLSASELGAYNGLPADFQMNAGDELVLPPRPGGYGPSGTAVAVAAPTTTSGPIEESLIGTPDALEPVDPASPLSDTSGVPAWSPDLAAAAIERSTGLQDDGSLSAPPSAIDPVPQNPTPARELASPDLSQYQTASSARIATPSESALPAVTTGAASSGAEANAGDDFSVVRPVDGPIALAFNKSAGGARNDGVDFDVPPGTPVRAGAAGEIALVSPSLGGLGTIVLMRHPNGFLTVYGGVDQVSVIKGDQVARGAQIGVVAEPSGSDPARMHFEVRSGATSLDPEDFFAG